MGDKIETSTLGSGVGIGNFTLKKVVPLGKLKYIDIGGSLIVEGQDKYLDGIGSSRG